MPGFHRLCFLIGGAHLPYSGMNIGPIAQDMPRQFYFDIAFYGCTGLDGQQQIVYSTDAECMMIKRIALGNCRRNILLTDSTKFQTRGFLKTCDMSQFEQIVTHDFTPDFEVPDNLIFLPNPTP